MKYFLSGVTILASPPKTGKTYLSIQMALAVSTKNSNFLGYSCNFAKVLYFSNETNEFEIQSRLKRLKINKCDNINFSFDRKMKLQEIEEEILRAKKTLKEKILVVIDTFQNLEYHQKHDNNNYQDIYSVINEFMRISEQKNTSFLLIHHLNKNKNENIFNSINGSIALTGATETNIVLDKMDNRDYQLIIQSRYINNNTIQLHRLDNGFFALKTDEILEQTDDLDIVKLIKFISKQDNQLIEDSATNICSKADLKFTTPNILYKKLLNNLQLLEQCNIAFSKRKSNRKNINKN